MHGSIRRGLAVTGFAIGALAFGYADAQTKTYTLNADFDAGKNTNVCHGPGAKSVCADPTADQLVLGRTPVSRADRVWADNYIAGWVIGLDVKTGKQISRFPSGLTSINGVPTGAQGSVKEGGAAVACDFSTKGDCPGRVTTDTNGDVWIINRGFGQQGTLSKFTTDKTHCIDRNGNGVIDTSSDANGDGVVDPDDPAEYFGQGDECILNTIKIGGIGGTPRGVAVDKKGKIWVSTWAEQKVYRINPNDPISIEVTIDLKTNAKTVGAQPYSMATGKDYVFISNYSTKGGPGTIRIPIDATDATTLDVAPCPNTYGIVADPGGTVAWMGGYFSGQGVYKADFTAGTCTMYPTMGAQVTAVTLDDAGTIWASGYSQGVVFRLNSAGVVLGSSPQGGPNPHGLSVDFYGNVWSVSDGGPLIKAFQADGSDLVLPVTPKLSAPNGTYSYTPYLYSDFTGTQIDRQAPYTRVGTWSSGSTFDAGANGVPWKSVSWNTEPQGAKPAETTISASVRAADDAATLGTTGFTPVTSGAAIAGVKGRFVEVKVDMTGPGYVTPVLSDITVKGPCDVTGEACCIVDADCTPQNACDAPTCPTPGGACVHTKKPKCCLTKTDCDDKNICTTDACPAPGGMCANTGIPGCCNNNSDCDDGMPCTADLCSGLGGVCSHQTILGCCVADKDCSGSLCSTATCPMPGGLCKITPKPACCASDKDCDDGNLCHVHTCDVATKACSAPTQIAGCCNADADCADNDPCTQDTCTGKGGICKHSVVPQCCSAMSPEVGKPCDLPKAPNDQPPCKAGKSVCLMGTLQCQGAVGPNSETCNGIDDNCDGVIDGTGSCPNGLICKDGYCAGPCKGGEFPCDPGLTCVNDLCVPMACAMVNCMPGKVCDPKTGNCVTPTGGTGGSGGAAGAAGSTGTGGAAGTGAAGKSGGTGTGGTGTGTGGAAGTGAGTGGAQAGGKAGASTGTGGAAAAPGDAATPSSDQKGGCGCEVPGGRSTDPTSAIGLLLAAAAVSRLRTRRERAGKRSAS